MVCDPTGHEPKNLVAQTRAAGQIQGDIFSEAERVKDFTGMQRYHYERVMANHFGIKTSKSKPKGRSAWDAVTKDKKAALVDGMNYDRPSQIFSKKFYGSVERKIEAWEKSKEKSGDSYDKAVGQPVKKLIKTIDAEIEAAKGTKDLNKRLSPFGLDNKTIYHGKEYLKWISEGGHTKQESHPFFKALNQGGSNLSKAQASLQMLWTLGNGADMQRVYSHYVTRKPSSVANVVQGTIDAIQATNGQPWRRLASLEKAGVYGSEHLDRGGRNITPFELSVTAQKNLTYFLDKASGGNGVDGIRDQLFDSKPWDRPAWDRPHPDANLLFGLARYPINESRWLVKTGIAAKNGDKREMANLLVYGVSRAFMLGTASNLPSWVLNKDQKEQLKSVDDSLKFNQVRRISRAIFQSMEIDAELDLSEYVSPLGGKLGSRAQSLGTTGEKIGRNIGQGVTDLAEGKVGAALVRGVGALSASANLTAWGKAVKALAGVNSTQVTDLADTLAKRMEGEIKSEGTLKREVAKDFFGSAVKKAK